MFATAGNKNGIGPSPDQFFPVWRKMVWELDYVKSMWDHCVCGISLHTWFVQLEIYNYVANTEVYVFWDALLAPFHSTPLTTFRDQLKECNGGPGLPRTRLYK